MQMENLKFAFGWLDADAPQFSSNPLCEIPY